MCEREKERETHRERVCVRERGRGGSPGGHDAMLAPHRGTSLIRNCLLLGPYSGPMLRALGCSFGGAQFLISEVPLYWCGGSPGSHDAMLARHRQEQPGGRRRPLWSRIFSVRSYWSDDGVLQ